MDTGTEFLCGQDVKSLSAVLPYPSTYEGFIPPRYHPSDKITFAFNRAQEYTFPRGFFASAWRLVDFWEDTVRTQMGITEQFIDPLIHAALRKKKDAKGVCKVDKDDSTLLDHLVQQTDGTNDILSSRLAPFSTGTQISVSSGMRPRIFYLPAVTR